MAIKAVFFDIDGTLLNDRKNVQQSTQKAIKSLKKQGIFVGLATGRGPSFVQPYLENLGLDFAVTYNGQYILHVIKCFIIINYLFQPFIVLFVMRVIGAVKFLWERHLV